MTQSINAEIETDLVLQRGAVHLVTGGAGFIGSHLTDLLLSEGFRVVVVDDFSLGTRRNIAPNVENADCLVVEADVSDPRGWQETAREIERRGWTQPVCIWHMAANSDIPAGIFNAEVDFRRTFMTTFEMIRGAERLGVRAVVFASTSAVYGELDCVLDEKTGPLQPISNYGAMKLASEAALTAATSTRLDRVWIFRFPNVVGPRATHGVIYDFLHKLQRSPERLEVLGNGYQQKPYLHVSELIHAMWHVVQRTNEKVTCVLIGPEDAGATVRFIAETVVETAGGRAEIVYGDGDRGWIGDVPRFRYSIAYLKSLGWAPRLSSLDAIRRAVSEIYEGMRETS